MPEIEQGVTVARGDYDRFYEHYEPFVTSFAARRISADAVADVVAETFAIAWRRRDVVPDDALPWLYRTARNVVGNRYRTSARISALQEKLRAIPAEQSADPGEVAADRDRVVTAFSELGEDDRELLLLVAWEGLTTPEIGAVMEISPGTAAVRLHRARARLELAMRPGELPTKGER